MEACKRAFVQKLPATFPAKESFMQKFPATFPLFKFKIYHHLFKSNPQLNPFLVSTFLTQSKFYSPTSPTPQRSIFSTFNCCAHDHYDLLKSKEPTSRKTQFLLLLIRIEAAISQKTQILLFLRTEPISQKTTNF
ncbi:hypothetical protein AMTRI_Chr13g119450 [Amborella trichopoda]